MNSYNELFEAGNKAQLEKMELNNHKTGYDNIYINYGYDKIEEELNELYNAIHYGKKDYQAIREEAADIANYAHMIIYKCDKEISNLLPK
jgi:NTP pyrophosphatase (non-canonical NTP hydrolase)